MIELSKDTIGFLREGDFLTVGNFRGKVLRIYEFTAYGKTCHAITTKAEGLPTAYGIPASHYYGMRIERYTPSVFYTGGGIWLSAVYVAPHIYAVVDNDIPADADDVEDQDCLTWYDDRNDDFGEWFACQGFIRSDNVKDLSAEDRKIWQTLREALLREMNCPT